ncbi:O-antigen ligase family protein [Dietzia sp. Alg238-R159]|uniref:O-antigen ligase family protein n=1 Tax=Dietzia sp. Alg238-R159 TaxID=2305986 RepID=UPI0013D42B94|nr:O-antigen ligase family protein [Dietzia sp. Alg238-R159]
MIGGAVVILLICIALFALSIRRPQWGVIAIAGLLPFHGLLLITPLSMNSWKEAAVLAVLAACPFARRVGSHRTVVAPWIIPLILLIPIGTVSAIAAFGVLAFFPLKIAFFYVLLPLIVMMFPFDRADKDRLVSVLLGAGVVAASYGIWQQFVGGAALVDLGYEWNVHIRSAGPIMRSIGTFNQPFPFGLFLMLVIVVATAAALAEPHRLRSKFFVAVFPVLAAGMLLSVVRASYIGVAVGLVAVGVLLSRRFLVRLLITFCVAVPVVLTFVFLSGSDILRTFVSSSSLEERGGHWSVNIPLVLSQPFGAGLGTTGSSAAKVSEGHDPSSPLYQPDSNYMKILLELGPIGLAAYALIVGLMVLTLTRMIPHTPDPLERGLLAGGASVALAACVAAFFATYLEIFPLDAYFWLLPAVAASTSRKVRDRVTGRQPASRPRILER